MLRHFLTIRCANWTHARAPNINEPCVQATMPPTDSGMTAANALGLVRERTRSYIPVVLSDVDALGIALTCATMERGALLELSHDRIVATEAMRHADRLKLTCAEFHALFCGAPGATATTKPGIVTRRDLAALQAAAEALKVQDELPETQEMHASIASALQTTLTEPTQKATWETERGRRLVLLGLLREDDADALTCLRHVLGEVVGSDLRRWEDEREALRDSGLDLMHVSETLAAVAAIV